jgi:hypothetical protein
MPWHKSKAAQRYLDALDPSALAVKKEIVVIGADYLRWTGEAIEDLEAIRSKATIRSLGTLEAAELHGAGQAYFAACAAISTVQDALNERFGHPSIYGVFADSANAAHRHDPWQAKRLCDAYEAALAQQVAA